MKRKSPKTIAKNLTRLLESVPEDADFDSVTPEQLDEVDTLFRDILNARFPSYGRDDNPVGLYLWNRSRHHVSFIEQPQSSDVKADDIPAVMAYVAALAASVNQAMQVAAEGQRLIAFYTGEANRRLSKDQERAREIAAFVELIESQQLDRAEFERDRLLDKYAPVQEFCDEDYPDASRKVPDDLAEAIEALGFLIPKDQQEAALAEINAAIDKIEPLVGKVYINERGDVASEFTRAETGHIWRMIQTHAVRMGKRALNPATVRYNRLSNEDMGLRLHARRTRSLQEA